MSIFKNQAIGKKQPLKPVSRLQREIIDKIEDGVINDPMLEQYDNIDLSGERYRIYTITSFFLRATAGALGTDPEINVAGLLTFERSVRENEEAEKTGNLVGAISPGVILKGIMKGEISSTFTSMEIKAPSIGKIVRIPVYDGFTDEDKTLLIKIQTMTAKYLTAYKLGISPEDWLIYLISLLMLKHSVLVGMQISKETNSPAVVNIGDTIEIKVSYKKKSGDFDIDIKPGKECKLEIKSDAVTEVD